MPLPRIKIYFNIFLFLFISFIIITLLTAYLYDKTSFLNIIENFLEGKLKNVPIIEYFIERNEKKANKPIDHNDYYIINFDKKTPSTELLDLLYYLKNSEVKYIIIDADFNKLMDYFNDDNLKDFFKENANCFAAVPVTNKKGLSFFANKFTDKEIYKKLLHINKTRIPLIFANYQDELSFSNLFNLPPDRIGFVNTKKGLFDANSIDVIYKFDKKYLLSAPFLIYAKEKGWDLNKTDYNIYYLNYNFRKLYYDQKGRMCFKYDNRIKFDPVAFNYNDIENSIKSRNNTVNILNELNIIKSNIKKYDNFVIEENTIDQIYNIQNQKDEKFNSMLKLAKDNALIWKGFKNANQNKLKSSYIFITQNNNSSWVNKYIGQLNTIKYGLNYIRLPLFLIILANLGLILLLLLLSMAINNRLLYGLLLFFVINIINTLLYFGLRIFYLMDYPFTVVLFTSLYGIVSILILKEINLNIWIKEVKKIYKASISEKYLKIIASNWKKNKWSLEEKTYVCSFMQVDTSILLQSDISKTSAKIISSTNSEIEALIKNNYGVRNNFSSNRVSCYFGNPRIENFNHAEMAINTAIQINNLPVTANNTKEKIKVAIISKEEWFKYVKKENQRYYTYFGNAIPILECMLKYADEYDIPLIITDTTYKLIENKFKVRLLDRIRIKGISQTFRLLQVLSDDINKEDDKFYDYFHAGLKLFENKKWSEAGAYFRQCLKYNDKDKPSAKFLERCKNLIANPPDNDWEPIYDME